MPGLRVVGPTVLGLAPSATVLGLALSAAVLGLALAAAVLGAGCGSDHAPAQGASADGEAQGEPLPRGEAARDAERAFPPTARVATWREMQADLEAPRHPSDGGGTVRLETVTPAVPAASPGRWSLVYTAGPHGIAEGGRLVFQAPPFWGWSSPQTHAPPAPGYTTVTTDAPGVVLQTTGLGQGMLSIGITGAPLPADAEVRVTYGAGEGGAIADRFAERRTPLWVAVDGDGDGVRALVAGPPTVDVLPRPPTRLIVTLPTVAHPGEPVELRIAAVDDAGNAFHPAPLSLSLEAPEPLGAPAELELAAEDEGVAAIRLVPSKEGVYAVRVLGTDGIVGVSNPMVVRDGAPRVLWGDLQIHSGLSDGTGTPADVYRYAREVAGLDVASVTDHDHWGMRFLDAEPALWQEVISATEAAYAPGRFVSVLGYEWTSWLYGHRHVLLFDGHPTLYSSMDDRFDTPDELWDVLRGRDALTIAHHSAGGPVAVDWSFRPDPELEPITEIVSVHGQSESPDVPQVIYDAVPDNFVVDVLADGARLGFLGSTDGHDGHPGLSHLAGPSGGLAGILAEERTREAVLEAIRARRVYATNGVRMLLRLEVEGVVMGGELPAPGEPLEVVARVVGTAPVVRLELVRNGDVVGTARPDTTVAHHTWTLGDLGPGEHVYVRAYQADGGLGWSSPVFVTEGTRADDADGVGVSGDDSDD